MLFCVIIKSDFIGYDFMLEPFSELHEDNDLLKKELKKCYGHIKKLKSVINVSSLIISSLSKKEVLYSILEQTKKIMNCYDSSILLIDQEKDELYFEALSDPKSIEILKDVRLKKGEGVAGNVWKSEKPIIIKDVRKDRRFSKKVDKKLNNITETLIAIPLIVNQRVIGVMEAINKKGGKSFKRSDLEIFQILANYAAIAIENAILYEMAITDGLTRLFVKSYFITRLTEELMRSERQNYDLSLIMFDLDHFKILNDTYGHQFGDVVLKSVSKVILNSTRKSDIPSRYGGEEFIVLLPDTNREGAYLFAERVRNRVKRLVFTLDDGKLVNVTVSAGIASFKDDMPKDYISFINMADKALYNSKKNGRDRVSLYSEMLKSF